jgi:dihydroxyacetone kinase-like predicted kinase
MLSLQPDGELDSVSEKMTKALATVQTGEITVATRTVEIDGVHCEDGQVIALLDGKLIASAYSIEQACALLLGEAKAEEHELITFYYGQDMTHAEANRIADLVRGKYSEQEIEVQEGGQPHYQFIISVE